jgi:uncharacterized membrane protein
MAFFHRIQTGRGRDVFIYVITVVLSAAFIIAGRQIARAGTPEFASASGFVIQAEVMDILSSDSNQMQMGGETVTETTTVFEAKILEGDYKGMTVKAVHIDSPFSPYKLAPVGSGDKVFLQYAPDDNSGSSWVLQDYRRTDYLIGMAVFVVALMLAFGRIKGVHTIVSLVFTCLAIFMVFIPSILSGKNIYAATIIIGIFIIAMTILIVNGASRKSLCSAVGCLFGFLASGLMTAVMDGFLGLTGLINEDAVFLLYLNPDKPIDLKAIIFASITIGALGAVMDVAISISSALHEVFQTNPSLGMRDVLRSGMNIGRDIIGTMSNTLILAYIGSSMSLVVLLAAYNDSLIILLNKEMIVVEVLQSLVGVAGLLMVIPLTSLVCAWTFTRKRSGS